jgi:hypothetical protein
VKGSRLDHVLKVGLRQQPVGELITKLKQWESPEMELTMYITAFMYEGNVKPPGPVYLIDGPNIMFNEKELTNSASGLIEKVATKNNKKESVVVVVTSFQNWVKTLMPNMEKVKQVLSPLHGNKHNVFFVVIGIRDCDRSPGTKCIKRIKVNPSRCFYKYCEFDDVLLTRIGTTFQNEQYKVITVSNDSRLVKEPDAVGDVSSELSKMGDSVTISLFKEDTF